MSRPKPTTALAAHTFRLHPDELEGLRRLATERGLPLNTLVRQIVARALTGA